MKNNKNTGLIVLPQYFKDISSTDKELLMANGRIEQYEKNHIIFKEGSFSSKFIIINSGYCATQVQRRVISIYGPPYIHSNTISTATPLVCTLRALSTVFAVVFDYSFLLPVLLRNPKILLTLLDYSILLLKKNMEFHQAFTSTSPEVRIAAVLWTVGEQMLDGTRRIPPVVTQDILADMLRFTREEVNKKRKLLVTAGYLYKIETTWYLSAMALVLFRESWPRNVATKVTETQR